MGNQCKMERNLKGCDMWKFKTMKSIHDVQFWVFHFPRQKICAHRGGRIKLEKMVIA